MSTKYVNELVTGIDLASFETSPEIFAAVVERFGDDQGTVLKEWQDPSDEDALVERAKRLREDRDEPLFWGASGQVA